ncbi:MAG: hypothetical protein AAB263_00335, partial [Planctomycetota bacterium]
MLTRHHTRWLVLLLVAAIMCGQEHPYLFFRAQDIPAIKNGMTTLPWSRDNCAKMQDLVAKHTGYILPKAHADVRDGWMKINVDNCQVASAAAFLYITTGDKACLEKAKEFLLLYARNFDERIDFHQLASKDGIMIYHIGTLGTLSAWTYDMIYNQLSAEERTLIENGLLRKIVAMVKQTVGEENLFDAWAGQDKGARTSTKAKDYSWGPGQWKGVMYCNAGITAIGFALNDPEIYEHGIANWKVYLARDMLADGFMFDEDFVYSRFCFSSLIMVAEMAHQAEYRENLYTLSVPSKPANQWDKAYGDTAPSEGVDKGTRNLRMFLDAQIDYQYPNRSAGNWGWQMNAAKMFSNGNDSTFYDLGFRRYGDPRYGWVLSKMDRSKGNQYAYGLLGPMLSIADVTAASTTPIATNSRWYNHNKWLVLKSIEGKKYWDSDALYAFMPYGEFRTKAIQRLSVDVFGFGKVLAPRLSKVSRLQSHDRDFYLNDDSWNNVMVDGANISLIKDSITNAHTRFSDFTPEIKIAQAQLDIERKIRSSIWYDDVAERRPDQDFTESRLLAMTDTYLIDITSVAFKEPQKFKRALNWNWHAFGDLVLDGVKDGELAKGQWSAQWKDQDQIGIKTTMLGSEFGDSTKVTCRMKEVLSDISKGNEPNPPKVLIRHVQAMRCNTAGTFIAIHEPFRSAPKITAITSLLRDDAHVVMKIDAA